MKALVNFENNLIDYNIAVQYMDDEIREDLHMEMAPCTEQEFFDAYVKRHAEKFDGEDFVENFGLASTVHIEWLSDEELIKAAEECNENSLAWIRELYWNHDLEMDEVWKEERMEDPQELLDYIKEYISKEGGRVK